MTSLIMGFPLLNAIALAGSLRHSREPRERTANASVWRSGSWA